MSTPPAPTGLRERQKAERRRAISDVATALFMERGFDEVTLAEVADAAGVSIKTIFNYFGSKEDLFLDREEELRRATIAAITDRPLGASITEGLTSLLTAHRIPDGREGWELLHDPEMFQRFRRFLIVWRASTSLQGRYLLGTERLADSLTRVLAAEAGLERDDDRVRAMAWMVVAAMHLRHLTMADAIVEDLPAPAVENRVRATAVEAVGRIAAAFPDLDLRRR